jgi:hypothetical protein
MKASTLSVDHQRRFFRLIYCDPKLSHRVDRALTILTRQETTNDASTIGNGREQHCAM